MAHPHSSVYGTFTVTFTHPMVASTAKLQPIFSYPYYLSFSSRKLEALKSDNINEIAVYLGGYPITLLSTQFHAKLLFSQMFKLEKHNSFM